MRYRGIQYCSTVVLLLCLILLLIRIGRSLLHTTTTTNNDDVCINDICYTTDNIMISYPLSLIQLARVTSNITRLQQEYMRIPVNMPSINELPLGVEGKNRYTDIIPNTHSRVPLLTNSGGSDYINANFITGYNDRDKAYIGTQGPLCNTVNDFWRMIWQQNVSVIIMVTGLIEGYRDKCCQYWPNNDGSVLYGNIRVNVLDRINKQHYTITQFGIENTQLASHTPHTVTHLWYTHWPDHGIPTTTGPLIEFIQQYRTIRSEITPTVVHCSAGIGRTGVFITIDIGISEIDNSNTVNIPNILSTIRQYRGGLVQTVQQYIFIYQALTDYSRDISSN